MGDIGDLFKGKGKPKREPSQDARVMAQFMHEFYTALTDDGMDPDIAIKMVVETMKQHEPEMPDG